MNIYLKLEKKPQQITNVKKLKNTTNITKSRGEKNSVVLINLLTHLCNTFPYICGTVLVDRLFI